MCVPKRIEAKWLYGQGHAEFRFMTHAYEVYWNELEPATESDGSSSGRFVEALSLRERQVLTQIAQGYTLAVAASQLGISRNTVHTHVKNIYQKLGVNSRSQAMLAAMRLRLFKP